MGSLVAYHCASCTFATDSLQVGWGKAGRAAFWGGLALCAACKEISVVNLSEGRGERRDSKCQRCNGPLKMIEGTADTIPCPGCGKPIRPDIVGKWG
jgi:hypothetical protein